MLRRSSNSTGTSACVSDFPGTSASNPTRLPQKDVSSRLNDKKLLAKADYYQSTNIMLHGKNEGFSPNPSVNFHQAVAIPTSRYTSTPNNNNNNNNRAQSPQPAPPREQQADQTTSEQYSSGFVNRLNYIPLQLMGHMFVQATCNTLGILRKENTGGSYQLDINPCQHPASRHELVRHAFQNRSEACITGPIYEELIFRCMLLNCSMNMAAIVLQTPTKKLPEEHPRIVSALNIINAIIFALPHAINDHSGAYRQAANIFLSEVLLPSANTRNYINHGFVGAIGGHIANNLFFSILSDGIKALSWGINLSSDQTCKDYQPTYNLGVSLLLAGLAALPIIASTWSRSKPTG